MLDIGNCVNVPRSNLPEADVLSNRACRNFTVFPLSCCLALAVAGMLCYWPDVLTSLLCRLIP